MQSMFGNCMWQLWVGDKWSVVKRADTNFWGASKLIFVNDSPYNACSLPFLLVDKVTRSVREDVPIADDTCAVAK